MTGERQLSAVELGHWIQGVFEARYPGQDSTFIERRFANLEAMFSGQYPGFQAMDTAYHDLEHTLQATLCMIDLMEGYADHPEGGPLGPEDFSIGLLAIVLHDLGYLKREGDNQGTGAKYTHVHEQRSCEHARDYLTKRGWARQDILAVEHLIRCTGPRSRLSEIPFQTPCEKLLGQMVCTADFVGQMSDPGYVGKLPTLYREFVESYDFQGLAPSDRPFISYEDLLRKTPGFWQRFVIPRMESDCGGTWRFLADPITGENPYRAAIERNIAAIESLVKS